MVIGTVILPDRITGHNDREKWPVRSECTPNFSFCYNDLAQHNVIINPDTLQVEAIIDWEVSGFYTSDFEAPLWTKAWYEPRYHDIGSDSVPGLIQFLLDGREHNERSSDDWKVVRMNDRSAAEAYTLLRRFGELGRIAVYIELRRILRRQRHPIKWSHYGIKRSLERIRSMNTIYR